MTLTLTPMIFNLGPTELIIILVIVLLLFGGSRLAGLGKSSGRALKEFKEETRGLRDDKPTTAEGAPGQQLGTPPQAINGQPGAYQQAPQQSPYQQAPQQSPYQQAAPQSPAPQTPGQSGSYQQAPQYDSNPVQPPRNLADPASPDSRRDV